MLVQDTSKQQWVVYEYSYTVEYQLLYSINPAFEDFELWEYGINCKLYDEAHTLLSEAEVLHISPDKTYVINLIHLMCNYKVFPAHLYDVIYDELTKDLEYSC